MAGIEIDLENLSDNPEELAKVFNQIESGETPTIKDPEPTADPDPAKTDEQTAAQQPKTGEQQGEPEPAGIATKDGKHVIPYSVLKSERDRAARAEQIAREMQEKVAELESKVASGSQGANDGESARTEAQEPNVADLSQEDLEVLKEDFPTVYKAVMASMAAAKALEAKLQPVAESVQQTQAEQARTAAETVQDAIDSVPKLAHLQASDPEGFELAKQFDATLRNQAAWRDKPLAERFAKVAEMVESAMGPIQVPGSKPPSPSAEELRAAAQAKAKTASKGSVPTSLSEFPAGQHAAQDEREAAEQLTPLQLAEKFSRMSPDEMDAYFREL